MERSVQARPCVFLRGPLAPKHLHQTNAGCPYAAACIDFWIEEGLS